MKAFFGSRVRRAALLAALLLLGLLPPPTGGYIEVLEESRCHDGEFRLTCRHLDAHLAILEVSFTPAANSSEAAACALNESEPTSSSEALRRPPGPHRVRAPLNHRCSGVHHCNFILIDDYKPSALWGPGMLYVKYACMEGVNSSRACSRDVTAHGEGFLQTPGYPRFYVGEQKCRWVVRAPSGQRVRLQLLDVSLRTIGPMEKNCTDLLTVVEEGRTLLSTCGEKEDLIEIVSEGDTLEVAVETRSEIIFPKRGVLLHFKAVDCVHPPPPQDGYVIYKNDTYGEYMCCVGYAFPDTLDRMRILQCINNNTWNNTLPNCIRHGSITDSTYSVLLPMRLNADANNNSVYAVVIRESDLMLDVLLPTIIICVLLVGNGVIIFVIYYLRKRLKKTQDAEMAWVQRLSSVT